MPDEQRPDAPTSSQWSADERVPRDQIIDATTSEFRRKAFHDVSLESVAFALGVRRGDVTWYFPTWEDLIKATIVDWRARHVYPLMPIADLSGAVALLRAITEANAADPALMRILVASVNIAATPHQPLAGWLRSSYTSFYLDIETALGRDIAAGREPASMEPAKGAEQLIALYEGLQIQSLVRSDMDLVAAYDRGVTRLRRGWATDYQPLVETGKE